MQYQVINLSGPSPAYIHLPQVYNCENRTEVYEDRSYRCYGVFSEAGLVYTVVQRLDLPHRCELSFFLLLNLLQLTLPPPGNAL